MKSESPQGNEPVNKYKLIKTRIDMGKVRHKNRKELEVSVCLGKNLEMNYTGPIRAGVIVYTKQQNKTFFCIGIDSQYGDLTDFGGGVKKEESVIHGALRELEEESQGVFGKITPEDLKESLAIYCFNMVVFLVERTVDMEKIKKEFYRKVKQQYDNLANMNNRIEQKIKPKVFSPEYDNIIYNDYTGSSALLTYIPPYRKTDQLSSSSSPVSYKDKLLNNSSNEIEVSNILWVDTVNFLDSVEGRGRKMYERVRRMLIKVTDVIREI